MSNLPHTIREINALGDEKRREIYRQLVPNWLTKDYQIGDINNPTILSLIAPERSRAVELALRRYDTERDPVLYINMADTFNHQILVLLVIVNDPNSERYSIDVDLQGNNTNFGTTSRNIPAEVAAKQAGLAPGQIRRGLRAFKRSVPVFEDFIARMGHELFLIEPLSYHNAIVFERYGFNYIRGLKDMHEIHAEFQPQRFLSGRLSEDSEFRSQNAANSIRGRSWAIHDGILGHSFTGFQMYKMIGKHAGISTAPDVAW